jgi:periplasmic copper chaperone A
MTNLYRLSALLFGLLLNSFVCAADIQVEGAWARATMPGQDVGMVSLTITSKQVAKLIGISSAACGSVEMHSMTHDNGMMKMREVKGIALPAGKRVDFAESGYHLMLVGLKAALKQGDSVPLTLRIKQANQRVAKVEVFAEVKSIAATQVPN